MQTKGQLTARLFYAPRRKDDAQRISTAGTRPEIQYVPIAGKGGRLRFAAFFGRRGRYQIQILATRQATCDLTMKDAGTPIVKRRQTNSLLAVRLPKTGRYTVWISSQRGAGNYTFRLIDGD